MLQIDYVTIGKDAYLLEVPESLCRSIPKEYELQSSKKVSRRTSTWPMLNIPIVGNCVHEISCYATAKFTYC